MWQSSTEPSSAVIYPVGPADGCNRSLFKFASEPGKQPGAQRGLARKMFTDSGCLTTVLPPSLPLTPHSPLQYNSHKNTCSCTHTCSCRLSVATLLLPLSNFSLSSHLLHTHAYIHMHTHTHTPVLCMPPSPAGNIPGADMISHLRRGDHSLQRCPFGLGVF